MNLKKILCVLFTSLFLFSVVSTLNEPSSYAGRNSNKGKKTKNPNKRSNFAKPDRSNDGKAKDIKFFVSVSCTSKKYRSKIPYKSAKEAAKDTPQAAKQASFPCMDPVESAQDYTIRVIVQYYNLTTLQDERLVTGPGEEFSKIKKWAQRAFKW